MRLSIETIENKLNLVPKNIREVATSPKVAEELGIIAKEHNLHIDEAGILDEETLYVMLGLETSQGFVTQIEKRLGVPHDKAVKLVQDINDRVFLSIRKSLVEEKPAEINFQKNTQESSTETNPSREDILSEIEDPTPSVNPISSITQKPTPQVQSNPIPLPQPEKTENKKSDDVAHDFIGGKLTEPVNLPTKRATIDPYREALE